MAPSEDAPPASDASVAVPAMIGFCGVGVGAVGFGAGYGARSYFTTAAYKDLIEKFPEPPTAEVEALARGGATRAFLGGTALAACMGIGAVMTARMYGICSAAEFGDEIRKWLPTQARLEVRQQSRHGGVSPLPCPSPALRRAAEQHRAGRRISPCARSQTVVVPKIAPLQRTITEHLQGARDAASGGFQKSELGRRMSERAQGSVKEQKLEPWEKEIIATLEGKPPAPKK